MWERKGEEMRWEEMRGMGRKRGEIKRRGKDCRKGEKVK